MEVPSIPVLTAAPTELNIGGATVRVRPLTIEIIGQLCERFAAVRISQIPSVGEVLRELTGIEPAIVRETLRTLGDMRREASEPTIEEAIDWATKDPRRLMGLILDCVTADDHAKCDSNLLLGALIRNPHFISRWLELSGLAENPTVQHSTQPSESTAAAV